MLITCHVLLNLPVIQPNLVHYSINKKSTIRRLGFSKTQRRNPIHRPKKKKNCFTIWNLYYNLYQNLLKSEFTHSEKPLDFWQPQNCQNGTAYFVLINRRLCCFVVYAVKRSAVDIKNRPRIPIPDEDPYSIAGTNIVAATREQLIMQSTARRGDKPPKLPPRDPSNPYPHDIPKVKFLALGS